MATLTLTFTLSFKSDWHINAGYGMAGKADAVIQRANDGTPIIRGATLKGLFRDALYDLTDVMQSDSYRQKPDGDVPNQVLGSSQNTGLWHFGMARPQNAQTLRRQVSAVTGQDDAQIVAGVRIHPATRRAENTKFFRRELGASDLTFTFTVTGTFEDMFDVQPHVEWLIAAARFIRRLGGRRRRGLGACEIALKDEKLQASLLKCFEQRWCDKSAPAVTQVQLPLMHRKATHNSRTTTTSFRVYLHTETPLVLANRPEAGNIFAGRLTIPGQALRGALAAYIAPQANTADYDAFTNLFVFGGMSLTNLNPLLTSDDQQSGIIAAELPIGLRRPQEGETTPFVSMLSETELKQSKFYSGFVRLQSDFEKVETHTLLSTDYQMHVKIDPQLKRASTGDLYSYEAIPDGRYYVGEIRFTDEQTWQAFHKISGIDANLPFTLRLGKAIGRGYGMCKVYFEPEAQLVPHNVNIPLDKRCFIGTTELFLTLASDTILLDIWGRAVQSFEDNWLSKAMGFDVAIDNRFEQPSAVRVTTIDGFDVRSGLPRWRDLALAQGSSVRLLLKSPLTQAHLDKLAELENAGIGLRCNEGFGRVVFNHPAHTGQRDHFKPALSLPQVLRKQASTHLTRSAFVKEWRGEVEQGLTHLWLKDSTDLKRSLARTLVEHANDPKLIETIKNFGKRDGKEQGLFDSNALAQIAVLLQKLLSTRYAAHHHSGVVLLAEALLREEKA